MPATLNTTTTTTVIDVEERVRVRPVRTKLNGKGSRGGGGKGRKGGNGNNGGGNNNNGGGNQDDQRAGFSPARYWVCLATTLAAVLMTFAVLTTAYVARTSGARDWQPIEMPSLLWLSTALILASSITFEAARRSLTWRQTENGGYRRWLTWTLVLGFGFLIAQAIVFRQLIARGFYLANNPHSAFFYILTGTHGVHLIGGIIALTYLLVQNNHSRAHFVVINEMEAHIKQRTLSGVVALYWHFIAGLWIFLFALLSLWK
jgi:cytochrome c oxidase subunit 3